MKTTITRIQLKSIYDIACQSWQPKIEKYAQKEPFSDTITFTENQIQEMIKACTAEQLPIVKEIFEVKNTWEDIKSVDDACKHLGEVDNEVRQLRLLQNIPNLDRKTIAGQELTVFTKAINGGWTADFDNHSQYKYILWWYLGKDFRLDGVCCDCVSSSAISARLSYESSEKASYSASQIKEIWKDYMNS